MEHAHRPLELSSLAKMLGSKILHTHVQSRDVFLYESKVTKERFEYQESAGSGEEKRDFRVWRPRNPHREH